MTVIGTDFGTSNSATVICKDRDLNGNACIIQVGEREITTAKQFPSFVLYNENAEPTKFGLDAQSLLQTEYKRTIYDIKRLIGRRFDEPEFQSYRHFLTYDVEPDPDGQIVIRIGNHLLKPEEVASDLMVYMLKTALEQEKDLVIDRWVVSVPAYYDLIKREKTKRAAMMAADKLRRDPVYGSRIQFPDYSNVDPASVNEIQLITEPTAALHTYISLNKTTIPPDKYVILFDLGAGTLDISIGLLSKEINPFDNSSTESLNVTSIHGNNDLGGRRMDEILTGFIEAEMMKKIKEEGHSVQFNDTLRLFLKTQVEKAKIRLSKSGKAEIFLENIKAGYYLTRSDLETQLAGITEQVRQEIRVALQKAGNLNKSQIGAVIMVGGPSKMPCIRKVVEEETIQIVDIPGWDPLICVAEGAARYAEHPVGRKEPTAHNYYIGGEMINGIIIPWQIAKTGDIFPIRDHIEVMVQRATRARGVLHNQYYLMTAMNGQYKAFNKITFAATGGGTGKTTFTINYPWKKIQYFNDQMNHTIMYSYDTIKIEYVINEEGLVKKPRFIDPLTGVEIQYSDIPQLDYGYMTVTDKVTFDRFREQYAREEMEKAENRLDEKIREAMNIHGISRRDAEYRELRPVETSFETLRAGARAAIVIVTERGAAGGNLMAWRMEVDQANVDSDANRQRLWNIIWASHQGMGGQMTEDEFIAAINQRLGAH